MHNYDFYLGSWESRLANAGLILGLTGNICLAFLFFPVTRGSSVLPLLGITSEGSVKYHIWLGHIVMTLFTAHGISYVFVWGYTHTLVEVSPSINFVYRLQKINYILNQKL